MKIQAHPQKLNTYNNIIELTEQAKWNWWKNFHFTDFICRSYSLKLSQNAFVKSRRPFCVFNVKEKKKLAATDNGFSLYVSSFSIQFTSLSFGPQLFDTSNSGLCFSFFITSRKNQTPWKLRLFSTPPPKGLNAKLQNQTHWKAILLSLGDRFPNPINLDISMKTLQSLPWFEAR